MKSFVTSLRIYIFLTLITGLAYPLFVYSIGRAFFPHQASGSLIEHDGKIVGSSLIAQKFTSDRYFYSRPSAGDFATLPSGASNFGPTSAAFKEEISKRQKLYGLNAPVDLLTASGSGLDPDLSPEAVYYQIDRVAKARGLEGEQKTILEGLVRKHTRQAQFGFLGSKRVNILTLNLELDKTFHE